jgi:hypothetical protein
LFLDVVVVDEVHEGVAEESEDVSGEEFDSGLAADLVDLQQNLLVRTVGDDDDVKFASEKLAGLFSLKNYDISWQSLQITFLALHYKIMILKLGLISKSIFCCIKY